MAFSSERSSATNQPELPLSGSVNSNVVAVNGRCILKREGSLQVVCVAGLPMAHWKEGDLIARAHAMVSLVHCGYAEQNEVAHAFGCSTRTLRRYQRDYESYGMAGLGRSNRRRLIVFSDAGPLVIRYSKKSNTNLMVSCRGLRP